MAGLEVPESPVFDPSDSTNIDDRVGAAAFGFTSIVVNGGYERSLRALVGSAPVPGPVKGLMATVNGTTSVGMVESLGGSLPKGGELAVILGSTAISALYGSSWGVFFTTATYGLSQIKNPGFDTGITPYAADGYFGVEFEGDNPSPVETLQRVEFESFADSRDRILGTLGAPGYLGEKYVSSDVVAKYVNSYASGDLQGAAKVLVTGYNGVTISGGLNFYPDAILRKQAGYESSNQVPLNPTYVSGTGYVGDHPAPGSNSSSARVESAADRASDQAAQDRATAVASSGGVGYQGPSANPPSGWRNDFDTTCRR